jgi:hypothetical protein
MVCQGTDSRNLDHGLTLGIQDHFPNGGVESFRYPPLSNGVKEMAFTLFLG